MKSNRNRIIRVIALALASCSILCACNKTKPNTSKNDVTENSYATSGFESTTNTEPITTQPVADSSTENTLTEEQITTEPATSSSSAKPTLTNAPGNTTKPVTATGHDSTTKPVTSTEHVSTTEPFYTTVPDNTVKPTETTTQEPTKAPPETTTRHSNPLANAAITADKIIGYRLISKDEIKAVAADIADTSKIYYVRLQDGTDTYYIAVDLQTAQALALSNPRVLRELCRQLDEKQRQMADKDGYVLMDYTHLVGELEVHYLGYLLTGALGAEDGPLASFYRSCSVADLNIDESRFGPIIDIIGTIYG